METANTSKMLLKHTVIILRQKASDFRKNALASSSPAGLKNALSDYATKSIVIGQPTFVYKGGLLKYCHLLAKGYRDTTIVKSPQGNAFLVVEMAIFFWIFKVCLIENT